VHLGVAGDRVRARPGGHHPRPSVARSRNRWGTVDAVAVQLARPVQPPPPPAPKQSTTRTPHRSHAQTRELAAQVRAQHPQITQAELARRLGISATRLRQVDKAEVHPELPLPISHSNESVRLAGSLARVGQGSAASVALLPCPCPSTER
jgi:DNA-binding XRE family transcriptional regulator